MKGREGVVSRGRGGPGLVLHLSLQRICQSGLIPLTMDSQAPARGGGLADDEGVLQPPTELKGLYQFFHSLKLAVFYLWLLRVSARELRKRLRDDRSAHSALHFCHVLPLCITQIVIFYL